MGIWEDEGICSYWSVKDILSLWLSFPHRTWTIMWCSPTTPYTRCLGSSRWTCTRRIFFHVLESPEKWNFINFLDGAKLCKFDKRDYYMTKSVALHCSQVTFGTSKGEYDRPLILPLWCPKHETVTPFGVTYARFHISSCLSPYPSSFSVSVWTGSIARHCWLSRRRLEPSRGSMRALPYSWDSKSHVC